MNFEESLAYLLSLGHELLAIKLGLRNTELLLGQLGNPQTAYESVQIAGTNGKGSTAVVLESICRAARIPNGLYTSPHLVSITERIVVRGKQISEQDFARFATQVRSAAELLVGNGVVDALPTFFEHVTAIALLAFREANVRLAILETGLGGRLDATTVAGARTVAITPIALDHQKYLGNTLEQIADEKAAIIQPGITAIIAEQKDEALRRILHRCENVGVKPLVNDCVTAVVGTSEDGRYSATFETPIDSYENVLLGVRGEHQIVNVATAIRLAEVLRERGFDIPKSAIVHGIESATHDGRLEILDAIPTLLVDGAHNPSGARALRQYLDDFVDVPVTLIFGAMQDKNIAEMAAALFNRPNKLILTRPDNVRAAEVSELLQFATNSSDTIATQSVEEALQIARRITERDGLICVTGSLYLVGEVKALMQHAIAVNAL